MGKHLQNVAEGWRCQHCGRNERFWRERGKNQGTGQHHVAGDWGELDEEDRRENELSVARGFRLLSSYTLSSGEKLWIITEADRSSTTLLLPSEY